MVQWLRPSDEELKKRYSPELQKRSAEQGNRQEQEFDDYVKKLKEWSKSDKSSTFGEGSAVLSRHLSSDNLANKIVLSSLVRRERGTGCEAGTDRCAASSRKGGDTDTTGRDAQGDAGREMIVMVVWGLYDLIRCPQPLRDSV